MRLNTLDNENLKSKVNINHKYFFPNISNSTIFQYANSQKNLFLNKNRKPISLKKSKLYDFDKKKRNAINLVKMLNIEEKIEDIINTDLNLKRQKLKIDNNNSIKKFRLGLLKKKEEDTKEKDNTLNEIKKEEEENEENIEKIDNDLKDKERMLEKKFGEKFDNLIKVRNVCKNINDKLVEINEEIGNNKMEEQILVNYADELDNNFEKTMNLNKENDKYMNENNYSKYDQHNLINKKSNYLNELKKNNSKEIEYKNIINDLRKKRENKIKYLRENIIEKMQLKMNLEEELKNKRKILDKTKEKYFKVRNDLINRYHMKLYEGINVHNEGLSSIIKDIWKLNAHVNINFMPSYLDSKSIEHLFKKAKQSIEISRLRQEIKEAQNDFISNLKDWNNKDYGLDNINYENIKGKKLFNKNSEKKYDTLDENELFKTKISDISISYLEQYPKTMQFIIDYRKNHPQKFKKEMPKLKFKSLKFRSLNIPLKIIEKNNHIEKLKNFLEIKMRQNELNDKMEVERLSKEFLSNNYQDKYKVNVEKLFSSLFGDKKNEMLIYYSRLEKDMKDNNKIIQFHSKSNSIKLK